MWLELNGGNMQKSNFVFFLLFFLKWHLNIKIVIILMREGASSETNETVTYIWQAAASSCVGDAFGGRQKKNHVFWFTSWSSVSTVLFNKHITSGHAPIPHVTTKTYALVRSRLSRAAEKPQQNSKDVRNMSDNATNESTARLGVATRKNTDLPSNQRAGGGVD